MVPYSSNLELFPSGEFLAGRGANHSSQFGEDGLIEACLERFGAENKWCFEVGANDGLFFSNTFRLRCDDWHSVLIESDGPAFEKLQAIQSERARCVHERIGPGSLDRILAEHGAPEALDLGVIDIDGQDWWAWDGMKRFRPRLMLVEFEYGSNANEAWKPELNGTGQANLKAIEALGRSKGYEPLATTTVNMLFVKRELLT